MHHILLVTIIFGFSSWNAEGYDLDPFLTLESKDHEITDPGFERHGRFFNIFSLNQLPLRRASFIPGIPFTGLRPSGSAAIPAYSDSGPPHSYSSIRGNLNRVQHFNKQFHHQANPIQKPNFSKQVIAGSYRKPTNTRNTNVGQAGIATQASTSFTSAVRPAAMQTGFTPIINGQRLNSPVLANKVINQIKSPVLGTASKTVPTSSFQTHQSLAVSASSNKAFSRIQPAQPLLAVPVEKLTKARNISYFNYQGKKIADEAPSPFYIPSSSISVSSSTRAISNSGLKASESLKTSSSYVQTNQIAPQKASDFNCDGSQDLGWCDLGNTYPKSLVKELLAQCKSVIDKMHVEIPHNFEKLSDSSNFRSELDNASSREARERGNHESWSWAAYYHQGSLCEAERGFLRPEAAQDSKGAWNVIIQSEQVRQRVPIEMCRKTNSSCKRMLDCGLKSQCLQKYNYHLLLSLDPEELQDCPTMKLYRFPSACVCHVE